MPSTSESGLKFTRTYLPSGPLWIDNYPIVEVLSDASFKLSSDGQSGELIDYDTVNRVKSQCASVSITWDPEKKLKKVMAFWDEKGEDGRWHCFDSAKGEPTVSFFSDVKGTKRAVVACDVESGMVGRGWAKRSLVSGPIKSMSTEIDKAPITK
jgi:hypothetical protein